MQIIDRNGVVSVRLTQAEGRRLRDAAYISKRIAANLSDEERAKGLKSSAELVLAVVDEFCPKTEKLDQQDAETPPPALEETPAKKK